MANGSHLRNKVVIRIISLLMLLTIFSNVAAVAATGSSDVAVPCYDYTRLIAAGLSFGAGTARCRGEVSASDTGSTISITVRLWTKNDDGVWTILKTWSGTQSNTGLYAVDKTTAISAGTYKVAVSATVTTPSGDSERVSKSTPAKTYSP